MTNKENGDEKISGQQLIDRLEQLRAVNGLEDAGKITHVEHIRARNKIVPGLGDEMEQTRHYSTNTLNKGFKVKKKNDEQQR